MPLADNGNLFFMTLDGRSIWRVAPATLLKIGLNRK